MTCVICSGRSREERLTDILFAIMIQRLQSLWLLLVAACGILLCLLSPVQFLTPDTADVQHAYEIRFGNLLDTTDVIQPVAVMSVWPLAVLSVVIPLLALVTILLYKNRILQARLCVVNILLMAGYYVALAIYIWASCANFGADWYLNIPAALPLVNIVLTFMAIRLILKDEALVRAADRLR